jgi:hypothetical protein
MSDDFDDGFTPPTQPFGDLVPPPKIPGTAIAAATPAPVPPRHGRDSASIRESNVIRRFVARTLDAVDTVADAVAEGLGLRRT